MALTFVFQLEAPPGQNVFLAGASSWLTNLQLN